jgi:ABC-2 type transport system permease protein
MSATARAPALQEVRGPSAFGGGARRFWNLTWLLSVTDFKLNYFGTALGYLWSLIRPLLTFGVLYIVFTRIFRLGDQVPHYAALLLFNVMLFTFFSEATTQAVGCVVGSENVVRKMQFPRLAIPVSVVLTGLFNLCLNLIVVMIFLLATGVTPLLTWLALPGIVALLVVVTTGTSMLLAALFVRFRDIAPIWGVLSLVIFYGSPILYPVEVIPHGLRFLLLINPLAPIFEAARRLIIDPSAPTVVDAAGSWLGIVGPAVAGLAVCALGFWVFVASAPRIAEEL